MSVPLDNDYKVEMVDIWPKAFMEHIWAIKAGNSWIK